MKAKFWILLRSLTLLSLLTLTLGASAVSGATAIEAPTAFPIIADFEGGVPAGWFVYGDWDNITIDTAVPTISDTDSLALPGQIGNNDVLSVTANVPTWAGFGAALNPVADWSNYDALSFWFYGENLSTTHELEIQTVSGDDRRATFVDDFVGWQQIILPFSTFGAGGVYDVSQVDNWVFVLDGTVGSFKMDRLELVKLTPFTDFEGGVPAGWFVYGDWDNITIDTAVPTISDTDSLALTGQIGNNDVLSVTANVPTWAGFGAALNPVADWSEMQGVSFWFYGENLSTTHEFEIQTVSGDDRRATFVDDFVGWRLITLPFATFGSSPYDVSQVDNWVFILDGTVGSLMLDYINVYGGVVELQPKVDFEHPDYTVNEDVSEATVTVKLEPATNDLVTVTCKTLDLEGTATAGVDYTPVNEVLVFEPGQTDITVTIPISNDAAYEQPETVFLALSNQDGGTITIMLGSANNPAKLTILDNDPAPDSQLIDDFESDLPYLRDAFNTEIGLVPWGSNAADKPVLATTTIITPIPGYPATNTVLSAAYDITAWGGFNHGFSDSGEWVSQDWSAYDGLRFWLYGNNTGTTIQVEIFDNQALGTMSDSAERHYTRISDDYVGWRQFHLPFALFQRRADWQPSGAPDDDLNLTEVSGYSFGLATGTGPQVLYLDEVELYGEREAGDMPLRVQFSTYAYAAAESTTANVRVMLNRTCITTATVNYAIAAGTAHSAHDYNATASGTLTFAPGETVQTIPVAMLKDRKIEGDEQLNVTLSAPTNAALGWKSTAPVVVRDVPDPAMIDDFERGVPGELAPTGGVTVTAVEIPDTSALALPDQDPLNTVLSVTYNLPARQAVAQAGGGFTREFGSSKDWSGPDAFNFWFYGMNTGTTITVQILDNKTPDPGPSGWILTWSDEFDGAAGAEPDQTKWGYDIGGHGWGNSEWEYYTNERKNSALDGAGGLVITATTEVTATTPYTDCWYGVCTHTSARLLTKDKFDFMYGRAEARLKLPYGQGIWPAFWSLGNNFDDVDWPGAGEIDIMENIGKEPNIVHGTVHGPGYSGGSGIGGGYTYTEALANDYHVYAIEWEPDEIRWYFDDTQYFTLTHDMLPSGANWVFDHPFFLIMNVAVGGSWPGYPDESTTFPQTMSVDYVRVYQAPAEPERFETVITDNFTGWQQMSLPFADFTRSAEQAEGVPNDGLTLNEMWGYTFWMPAGSAGAFYLDEVKLGVISKLYLPLVVRQH